MSKKNYKMVFETYKYDYEFESEEFDDVKIVKGSYSSKEEAQEKAKELYEKVLKEFKEDLGDEIDKHVMVDDKRGSYCIWDYTAVDDEGYVKKWLFYVDWKRDYLFKIKDSDAPMEYYETEEEFNEMMELYLRPCKWGGPDIKAWKKVDGKWVLIHDEEWERLEDGSWKQNLKKSYK